MVALINNLLTVLTLKKIPCNSITVMSRNFFISPFSLLLDFTAVYLPVVSCTVVRVSGGDWTILIANDS